VSDPVGLLAAARERLRPDGLLWIATPNLAALGHRRFGSAWLGLEPPRHLVLFDHRSLGVALARSGFAPPTDVSPTPTAAQWFARSALIARDEPQSLEAEVPVPAALRLHAAIAELAGARHPRLREELAVIATAT
jgi:hypothetical protein